MALGPEPGLSAGAGFRCLFAFMRLSVCFHEDE
jgi:hypothetical protein